MGVGFVAVRQERRIHYRINANTFQANVFHADEFHLDTQIQ